MTKEFYTIKEVKEILGIGINSVYALVNENKLPSVNLRGRKVRKCDLEAFIKGLQVNG